MSTNVVIVKISHKAGSLEALVKLLSDNDINVEYMYGLSLHGVDATIVMKLSDIEKAQQILEKNNIQTLSYEDIKELQ